jgi:F0F1-type ATP synthase membrane subunit a
MITGINFVIKGFFGVFEGFLQAFVFTMLTITYLSMAVQTDETHETKKGEQTC